MCIQCGSIALWFISAFILSSSPNISVAWFDIFPILLSSRSYWLASTLIPVVALAVDFIGNAARNSFAPSNIRILQEAVQKITEAQASQCSELEDNYSLSQSLLHLPEVYFQVVQNLN